MAIIRMTLEQEFVKLVQQHAGIIFKVIQLYVDHPEERRDMHQEILLQAWKSYANFRGHSAFSTWLYRIALNTVLTFRRRQRLPTADPPPHWDPPAPGGAAREESEWLLQAIRALNEVERIIITLHLDGYSNEEIATITGLNRNATAVRLHRIKQTLTTTLQKWSNRSSEKI